MRGKKIWLVFKEGGKEFGGSNVFLFGFAVLSVLDEGSVWSRAIIAFLFLRAVEILWKKRKKKMVLTKEERWRAAIHEAGHAVMGRINGSTVEGVKCGESYSIDGTQCEIQMGETRFGQGEGEDVFGSYAQRLKFLQQMFGGRVAEGLFFEACSFGGGNDLQNATRILRELFWSHGVSKTLGLISIDDEDSISQGTLEKLEEEMKEVLQEAEMVCRKSLEGKKEEIEKVARALLEKGELSGDEFLALVS
ncbi:MAG TPA: hypothetical protein VJB99_02465 [Patescibacteria group bacterium]|nr:hypothetical protein [Patescibacteria group bacterium]